MEWVETTGKTVEEAKDAALDQLGVDEQDAEFDIVEEPKLGLFGRVRNEARVRARVRPTSPRAKDDGRNRRRRRPKATAAEFATESATDPDDTTGVMRPPPAVREETPAMPASARADHQRRGSHAMERSREREGVEVPLLEQAEVGRAFLVGLLGAFSLSGEIAVRQRPTADDDEEVADLLVTGEELGVLIGPGGATLNAIQEITRTVVNGQSGGRNGRLLVDIGGYRAKRADALERFVRQVADQVRASGDRLALEPMHAADRKVVHDTVNTIDGVSTISEGEEPRRRVVLEPTAG
ncbi:MAG: RNA-binding cell elongation regulator Jag/EloR [Acidimicrobiales bacterium]